MGEQNITFERPGLFASGNTFHRRTRGTPPPGTSDEALAALKNASGHIRTLMGKKLPWRTAPELRFFLDKSVDEAERIAKALANERARMDALKAEHEDEADSDAQADADGADAEEA